MNSIFKKIPKPKWHAEHIVWADEMTEVQSLLSCRVASLPCHWVVLVGVKVVVVVKVVVGVKVVVSLGHWSTVVST